MALLTGALAVGTACDEAASPAPASQAEPVALVDPLRPDTLDCTADAPVPGPALARRLTNAEYANTVADMLGVELTPAERARLPRESFVSGFRNTARALSVSQRHIDVWSELARQLAGLVAAERLTDGFDGCQAGQRCVGDWLDRWGRRLFRRPPTDAERARYARLFDVAASEGDGFETGARLALEAMLQSPPFLYRIEASGQAELPRQARWDALWDAGAPVRLGPGGALDEAVELAPGEYRVTVVAAAEATQPEQGAPALALSVAGTEVAGWTVASGHPAPYLARFEVRDEPAGAAAVRLEWSDAAAAGLRLEAVELVGPLAHTVAIDTGAAPAGVRRLDDFELASRLSYLIWHSAPDDWLLDEAAAGRLQTDAQIAAAARRMLDDDRARRAFRGYIAQWLRLDRLDALERDPAAFPEFDDALLAAMKEETWRLFERVVWHQQGDLVGVLTADATWADRRLAELYDLPAPQGAGDQGQRYDLSARAERGGLLTQASVLTMTAFGDDTSPVRRGLFVRTKLMCESVPPPPPGLNTELGGDADTPIRDRFRAHATDRNCSSCHRYMDPIGYGFEGYDAIGAWRTHYATSGGGQARAVDQSGTLHLERGEVGFEGPGQLSELLSRHPKVETCMVQKVYQYAIGRPTHDTDRCDLVAVRDRFRQGGRSYQSLVVGVALSDAFRYVQEY